MNRLCVTTALSPCIEESSEVINATGRIPKAGQTCRRLRFKCLSVEPEREGRDARERTTVAESARALIGRLIERVRGIDVVEICYQANGTNWRNFLEKK
jgi:hypothetical protein